MTYLSDKDLKHVEPNFRAWYEQEENQNKAIEEIKEKACELAMLLASHPGEKRCKALAQTKLQECVLWAKEAILKESEL